jgi:hypothetical protein
MALLDIIMSRFLPMNLIIPHPISLAALPGHEKMTGSGAQIVHDRDGSKNLFNLLISFSITNRLQHSFGAG